MRNLNIVIRKVLKFKTPLKPAKKIAESYPRGPLTDKQMEILRRIYGIDYLIYEVSCQVMDAKIEAFGRKRMAREVEKLKAYLENCKLTGKKFECIISWYSIGTHIDAI